MLHKEDVQEVFNEFYDYFISEILKCSSKMSIDIVKNECLNIPEPLTFEELEELVAKYGNQD